MSQNSGTLKHDRKGLLARIPAFPPIVLRLLDLLARDSMKTFQELADEAFRDLLRKYDRPTDLKAALRQSAQSSAAPSGASSRRSRGRRR